ncbi:MAG: hypothetical protein K8R88_10420 [Armatimonadetes bacterium]|nr:hypothetical protein [Armatimonadota bacterium]
MQNIGPCTEAREVPEIIFPFTDQYIVLRKQRALLAAKYWMYGLSLIIGAVTIPYSILAALTIPILIQSLYWASVRDQRVLMDCFYRMTPEHIQYSGGGQEITLVWDDIQEMEFTGESDMELKSISITMLISSSTPRFWDLHRLIAKLLISNQAERQDTIRNPSETIQNGERPKSWRRVPISWVKFED